MDDQAESPRIPRWQRTRIPRWQRIVCGALALGGGTALFVMLWLILKNDPHSFGSVLLFMGGLYGFFLFSYAAIKGRLPRFVQAPRARNRHT